MIATSALSEFSSKTNLDDVVSVMSKQCFSDVHVIEETPCIIGCSCMHVHL
jgi:predicted transcriptional regulator